MEASHQHAKHKLLQRIVRHALAICVGRGVLNVLVVCLVKDVERSISSVPTVTERRSVIGSAFPGIYASHDTDQQSRYVERLQHKNEELAGRNHEYLEMLRPLSGNLALPLAERGALAELVAKVIPLLLRIVLCC